MPTCHTRPIHILRWQNFRALIGPEVGGIVDAAKRLEKSQGQVSHFGGKRPIKNIGDDIATEIEAAWGKPSGWLDEWHEQVSREMNVKSRGAEMPAPSQFRPSDPDILSRALFWLDFEERSKGLYQGVRRAERLMALYQMIQADGGELSPKHQDELIDATRQQGAANNGRSDHVTGGS